MVEKTNNIDDAEIKYKQALKNYHKESNRHVLVLEADVTEEQKRMILHTSNLIRIAGNCLGQYDRVTRMNATAWMTVIPLSVMTK